MGHGDCNPSHPCTSGSFESCESEVFSCFVFLIYIEIYFKELAHTTTEAGKSKVCRVSK